MRFFELEPEMPGDLGPSTTGDLISRPPKIKNLEFEFNVWPDDCLVEAIGTYIVIDTLRDKLILLNPTGVTFDRVKISKSEFFREFYRHLYPNRKLPAFSWLKITGQGGKDDFGLSPRGNLIVSLRVLELLKEFGLNHCEIENYNFG